MFSCHGIQLAVDWFLERGHQDITVFVPAWRKEQSRPDALITGENICLLVLRQSNKHMLTFKLFCEACWSYIKYIFDGIWFLFFICCYFRSRVTISIKLNFLHFSLKIRRFWGGWKRIRFLFSHPHVVSRAAE